MNLNAFYAQQIAQNVQKIHIANMGQVVNFAHKTPPQHPTQNHFLPPVIGLKMRFVRVSLRRCFLGSIRICRIFLRLVGFVGSVMCVRIVWIMRCLFLLLI